MDSWQAFTVNKAVFPKAYELLRPLFDELAGGERGAVKVQLLLDAGQGTSVKDCSAIGELVPGCVPLHIAYAITKLWSEGGELKSLGLDATDPAAEAAAAALVFLLEDQYANPALSPKATAKAVSSFLEARTDFGNDVVKLLKKRYSRRVDLDSPFSLVALGKALDSVVAKKTTFGEDWVVDVRGHRRNKLYRVSTIHFFFFPKYFPVA